MPQPPLHPLGLRRATVTGYKLDAADQLAVGVELQSCASMGWAE